METENEPITPGQIFTSLQKDGKPQAMAWVKGGPGAPYLNGLVKFYETPYGGVLTEAELFGLPDAGALSSIQLYHMDIRENENCSGKIYFLPPLLSRQGYAWLSFYDRRFAIPDITGKILILRRESDEFSFLPSEEKGGRIGSGMIRLTE